jgi:hypothetical protein
VKRIAAIVILAACGGGKGGGLAIPGSTPIVVLTATQQMQLCQQAASLVDQRTVQCSDGSTVTVVFTVDNCLAEIATFDPSCDATADDMLACSEDFAAQSDLEVCAGEPTPSCEPLLNCVAVDA